MDFKEVINFLKTFAICFAIAIPLEIIAVLIESDLLIKFLKAEILTLLLALLAINAATLGVTVVKIQDLLSKYEKLDFKKSIHEMLFSLKEQVILIIISVLVMVIVGSKVITFEYKDLICNSLLYSVFFYSIWILWDTAKSVFKIIEIGEELKEIEKKNKKED